MLNSLTMTGFVGKVSELKEVKGKKVLNFSIAQNRGKKDEEKKPDWFNLSVWEEQAVALSKILADAKNITIEGSVYNRDAKDEDSYPELAIRVRHVHINSYKTDKE